MPVQYEVKEAEQYALNEIVKKTRNKLFWHTGILLIALSYKDAPTWTYFLGCAIVWCGIGIWRTVMIVGIVNEGMWKETQEKITELQSNHENSRAA